MGSEQREDPAALFFPDGERDLYEVLELDRESAPSTSDIRRAYRRLALRYHPDKAALHGPVGDKPEAALAFQQIGFAYSVLSDETRRKRYDATGSTDESIFAGDGPVDWDEYFKTLWTGEVNAQTLDEFKSSYQGSEEERNDILQAYREHDGSLEAIFAAVPCSNILEDEERFIDIVDAAVRAHDLDETDTWASLRSAEGKKHRKALRSKASREAEEAEAYARELGVYDKLFGKDKGEGKAKKGKGRQQVADAPAEKKASDEGGDDEDVDLEGLRAAMRAKAGKRATAFDDMISGIEERHRPEPAPRTKRARKGHA